MPLIDTISKPEGVNPFLLDNTVLGVALICAEASKDAYARSTFSSGLASVLIIERDDAAIIAFMGTRCIRDFLTDFQCRRIDGIHGGFHRSFDSVRSRLIEEVKPIIASGKPIFITGHSKGGAEAVIAFDALWPMWDSDNLPHLHTFGQPRAGDANFAARCEARFGARHTRWVNQEDIVPRVPLWVFGNRHSGNEEFFSSMGGVSLAPGLLTKVFSDIYGTWMEWKARRIGQIADHGIEHYLAELKEEG